MDPLDLSSHPFEFEYKDNPIGSALSVAAGSYSVFHGFPGGKYFESDESNASKDSKEPRAPQAINLAVFPPPVPDETDADKLKLLHSWYWAGYYAGVDHERNASKNI